MPLVAAVACPHTPQLLVRPETEDRDLVLENLGKSALDPIGPGVLAVGKRGTLVRARNGGEDFGRDPRGVFACEIQCSLREGESRVANGE